MVKNTDTDTYLKVGKGGGNRRSGRIPENDCAGEDEEEEEKEEERGDCH